LTIAAGSHDREELDMASTPTAAPRDLLVVWLGGLVLAAGLGLGAAILRGEQFWLVFGVFTACFLSPCIALSWLVVGPGRGVTVDPRAEENVESRWIEKAASGAMFDLVPAAGVTLGAVSLFGLDLPGDLALLGVVVFAFVDGGLRYAVLSRRES
jgi:hypothetical protein